jgi:hypothetical protein
VPAAGVPLSAPDVLNVTPAGNVPVLLNVGAGDPVAVTVNDPGVPTVNDVLFVLVIAGGVGGPFTVRVKFCVALGVTPFCAVNVIGKLPLAVGVPLKIPLAVSNATPPGNAPVSLNVGAGDPVTVTVNVPALPTKNVVLFKLVIAGACLTVSVKLCVAFGLTPFCAVNVSGYVPLAPAAGVPLSTPPVVNVTPAGSAPVSLNVGAGDPVAVAVNVPRLPTTKFALFELVNCGAAGVEFAGRISAIAKL